MNYEQLLLSALSKADEEPGDEIIDNVAEKSVNQGYQIVATEIDLQIKTIDFEYIGGYEFPENFHSLVNIKNKDGVQLSHNDYYIESRKLYITNKDFNEELSNYTVRYVYFPEHLVGMDDEPLTSNKFDYMITLYGAYNVLLYKKRYNMAQMILGEFMRLKGGELEDDI